VSLVVSVGKASNLVEVFVKYRDYGYRMLGVLCLHEKLITWYSVLRNPSHPQMRGFAPLGVDKAAPYGVLLFAISPTKPKKYSVRTPFNAQSVPCL
jgi:hypothetical protein